MRDRVVLVTGASSGLGKSTAIKLKNLGYDVYAVARRVDAMADLEKLGINIGYLDVTDEQSVDALINRVSSEKGRIDVLVNNAGYGSYGSIEDVSIESAKRQFEVNVFGLVSVTKRVIPIMRKRNSGLIINISSVVGKASLPFMGWYSASKHAVEGLSDAMRLEVSQFGIKVVIVEPGVVKTGFDEIVSKDFSEDLTEAYKTSAESFKKGFSEMYASKSAPTGEDIANEIAAIVESKNPKIRYRVTKDAKVNLAFKKFASDKLFDKVLKSKLVKE